MFMSAIAIVMLVFGFLCVSYVILGEKSEKKILKVFPKDIFFRNDIVMEVKSGE